MYNQILEALGQDAKSQVRSETSEFDVDTQSVKRGLIESAFDKVTGREKAIQEEAAKKYTKDLKETKVGEELLELRDTPGITSKSTKQGLRRQLRKVKEQDAVIGSILGTGEYKGTRADLQAMDIPSLTELAGKTRRSAVKTADAENPVTQRAIANAEAEKLRIAGREKESDRRYYEDRINARETKLMELDLKKQGQRNEMAMFDKRLAADARANKRERMMALMSGLANLGGAFAI